VFFKERMNEWKFAFNKIVTERRLETMESGRSKD
jgi:hypothetical protein